MSNIDIKSYIFNEADVATLGVEERELNWPVVYQIYNASSIYIGETTNLKNRMSQHLKGAGKESLEKFSVIFDDKFNKSVALDLESQLIQWFSGEGSYSILNRNEGIADREYYNRESYRKQFSLVWEELRKRGITKSTVEEIENSGLFKFSPYKRLNSDQMEIVQNILLNIDEAFVNNTSNVSVITGNEGTGKTILIMYLAKLIRDIQDYTAGSQELMSENFEMFFNQPFINERFKNRSIAIVVPSQSLKGSISKIFKNINNMSSIEVLSPIEFGSNGKTYDITLVDEAHLLKVSNQEVHKALRERVDHINRSLFNDDEPHTELEWITKKSLSVVMVYGDQRVRPNHITDNDLPKHNTRMYTLKDQMRSRGGKTYIEYLKAILSNNPPTNKQNFDNFELKLYEDFNQMTEDINDKEQRAGLSRLVAGFAWPWKSKKDKSLFDIQIQDKHLRWNSVLDDWVGSSKSANEVGSIYTIQGYDLNYCGVIIGNDLRYDPTEKQLFIDRANHYDKGAKKRNKRQIQTGLPITDEELFEQITRTYRILMNRSIRGTFVYACDPPLREYLSKYMDVR